MQRMLHYLLQVRRGGPSKWFIAHKFDERRTWLCGTPGRRRGTWTKSRMTVAWSVRQVTCSARAFGSYDCSRACPRTPSARRCSAAVISSARLRKAERRPNALLASECDKVLGADGTLIDLFARMVAEKENSARVASPASDVAAFLPALRRALDTYDLPDDGPEWSLAALSDAVGQLVNWRLNSNYLDLARRLLVVLPALHQASQSSATNQAELGTLLAQSYRCADAIADKLGYHDLSARIIDLMRAAAGRSEDELTIATSSYVRAETFFASGDWSSGRRMLEIAADQIGGAISPEGLAAYGALHMRAAVLAGRDHDQQTAKDHIDEAADASRRVPDGVYRGTAFGPASVRIHQLALALDLRDFSGAIKTGEGWAPPPHIPAERRSHFFLDLARAYVGAECPDRAIECLATARSIAPQHIRRHPDASAAVTSLLATVPRPDRALLEFARWGGVLAVRQRAEADRAAPEAN
jgi:hypothetical protein